MALNFEQFRGFFASWAHLGAALGRSWVICIDLGRFLSIFVDFWSIFGRFLVDFGLIFGRFLVDFWSIFCRFLLDFWSIFLGVLRAPRGRYAHPGHQHMPKHWLGRPRTHLITGVRVTPPGACNTPQKIDQKSTKNRQKIDQKSTKNRPKIAWVKMVPAKNRPRSIQITHERHKAAPKYAQEAKKSRNWSKLKLIL